MALTRHGFYLIFSVRNERVVGSGMRYRIFPIATTFCWILVVCCQAQPIVLTGTATDAASGHPLANVSVSLKSNPTISALTGADGTFRLTDSSSFAFSQLSKGKTRMYCVIQGDIMRFSMAGTESVSIELFAVSGSRVRTLARDAVFSQGGHSFNLASQRLAPGLYCVRIRQGNASQLIRFVRPCSNNVPTGAVHPSVSAGLSKNLAGSIDTLIFSCCGYSTSCIGINDYSCKCDAALLPLGIPEIAMVSIAAGTFTMGSDSAADVGAAPPHRVTLSAFSIGATSVTQALYKHVMCTNPSHFTGNDSLPVETATWFDAVLFCNALSKQLGKDTVYSFSAVSGYPGNGSSGLADISIDYTKHGFRLPTEAEWEYACRAGSATTYFWGCEMDTACCWYYDNSNLVTHPVATRKPNAWGLYDMSGNVRQWCNDWYAPYDSTAAAQNDPIGPLAGVSKANRGGGWYLSCGLDPGTTRSADRGNSPPSIASYDCGFRCVLK